MADIYDASAKHLAALAADERAAASAMLNAWGQAWEAIHADLDVLTVKIEAARAAGEDVGPAWLQQQRRLRTLQADAEQHLRKYARTAALETQQLRQQAVAAAHANAAELTAAARAGGKLAPTALGTFDRVPPQVLELLVGNLSAGSPLAQLFAALPGDGVNRVTQALVRGVSKGLGPRQVAREVQQALGGNLARALTIARTEQLRVYREANRMAYEANEDLVAGWRWTCARDLRTCSTCWAMDGTEHPVTDRLDGHPNCRCTMVPLAAPGQTFGLEDGPDAFAKLPAGQQRAILGPSKYAAYEQGQVSLRDMVGRTTSPKWGTTRRPRTLSETLADRHADADFRLGAGITSRADRATAAVVAKETKAAAAAARRDMVGLRARMRTEAGRTVADMAGRMDRLEGGRLRSPDAGGEWDWFRALSPDEQKRLRRDWVGQPGARLGPDDMARLMRVGDLDRDPMEAWLEITRTHDAGKALVRGKYPSAKPYGGRPVRGLTPELEADGYDPAILAGNDADAIDHVADVARRMIVDSPDAADWTPTALRPARSGPDPWAMSEADYVAEVEDLRDLLGDIDVDEFGQPLDPAFIGDADRLADLDPGGLDPYGDEPEDPAEMWRLIRAVAERQGLV